MRAVLTYHSIDDSGSPVSVPESAFRAHVRWLASGRVRVVPLREILRASPGEDAVAITFDDALQSFGDVAAPILLEAELPATVFVPSGYAGSLGDWEGTGGSVPVHRVLGWSRLRDLVERGVDVGAHSGSHPVLTGLGDEALREEVHDSKARIEAETGATVTSFSYPYGIHDDRVVEEVAGAFEIAVTADLGVVGPDVHPLRIPRLDMWYYREPRRLESWGGDSFAAYLGIRRLARRTKRAFTGGRP